MRQSTDKRLSIVDAVFGGCESRLTIPPYQTRTIKSAQQRSTHCTEQLYWQPTPKPMRITLKWFATGNTTTIEERDELLSPNTTIWEVKGFVQIKFGFKAKDILILTKRLLENDQTLKSIGIVDQATADATPLTTHVVSGGLEGEAEDDADDGAINEFTHEDMELAMRMLGKQVPVSSERIAEMRENAPRARPRFLNSAPQGSDAPGFRPAAPPSASSDAPPSRAPASTVTTSQPAAATPPGAPPSALRQKIVNVFTKGWYSLRAEGADEGFQVVVPGAPEPYQYWDLRLPEDARLKHQCAANEVAVEMYFFGEWAPLKKLGPDKFGLLVAQMLQGKGFKPRLAAPPREAGCMYPLVAVACILNETECWELGHALFDEFGKPVAPESAGGHQATAGGAGAAGGGGGCKPS